MKTELTPKQFTQLYQDWTALAIRQERERIIKLLESQYDNFDENGMCVYEKHIPTSCNCDVIALIKGENK